MSEGDARSPLVGDEECLIGCEASDASEVDIASVRGHSFSNPELQLNVRNRLSAATVFEGAMLCGKREHWP